jgi:hypothetical protein
MSDAQSTTQSQHLRVGLPVNPFRLFTAIFGSIQATVARRPDVGWSIGARHGPGRDAAHKRQS